MSQPKHKRTKIQGSRIRQEEFIYEYREMRIRERGAGEYKRHIYKWQVGALTRGGREFRNLRDACEWIDKKLDNA